MKVAIVGAGAMGCLYGAKLAFSGNEVTMVVRRKEVCDIINSQGLILEQGARKYNPRVMAALAGDLSGSFDLIILFTKTNQSQAAMTSVKHLIGTDTYLLTLQNGLGNEEVLLEYASPDHILIGASIIPSDLVGVGQVKSVLSGNTKMMVLDGKKTEKVAEIGDVFNQAGLECSLDEFVLATIWEKAAFNCSLNCLAAIARIPAGGILKAPEGLTMAQRVIEEVLAVAQAYGVDVSIERVMNNVHMGLKEHADHYPSMAQDILSQKESEVEMLCGKVIERARYKNLPVATLETFYQLVKLIEANY